MPGRGMSFILYVVVLVVSISSVMMGLDWLSTPPPPVPKSVQTVSLPAKPAARTAAITTKAADKPVEAKSTTAKTPVAQAAQPKPAESKPATSDTADTKTPATEATAPQTAASKPAPNPAAATTGVASATAQPEPAAQGAATSDSTLNAMANESAGGGTDAQASAGARCDVQACAAHYHSFDPGDCTYQPYDGPRRLCTVGHPPGEASNKPAGVQTSDARQQPTSSCNVQACAAAYRSFDPATCTYQPYEGPRRACDR